MEYQKEIQRPYFNFQDNRKSKKRMFQFPYFQQEDIITPRFPLPLGPGPSPPRESQRPPEMKIHLVRRSEKSWDNFVLKSIPLQTSQC